MGRITRGQGVAVSVAILTAVTLVMALAMYSYFTSQYAQASIESRIEMLKTRIMGSISYTITHSTSQQVGSYWVGCNVVKIYNRGDVQVKLYYTVLPIEASGTATIIGGNITVLPVDQYTGDPMVFVYTLEDLDLDGIVDVIGYNSSGKVKIKPEPLLDCSQAAVNDTVKQLSMPPETSVEPGKILLGDVKLEDLLEVKGISLAYPIPLWSTPLSPGEGAHLLIIVVSTTGTPPDRDLTILAKVDNGFVYVDSISLD